MASVILTQAVTLGDEHLGKSSYSMRAQGIGGNQLTSVALIDLKPPQNHPDPHPWGDDKDVPFFEENHGVFLLLGHHGVAAC